MELFEVLISANALEDVQQAVDWENSRSAHLGDRLLLDLEKRIADLAKHPYIGSVRYDDVRCIKTKVFQYLIHYIPDDKNKQVIISQIIHISRKPAW